MKKILLNQDELVRRIDSLRSLNNKIVLTSGCFDLFHQGHVYFLNESKKHGDILVVLVNSDKYIGQQKGHGRPVNQIEKRMQDLSFVESVDIIFALKGDSVEESNKNLIDLCDKIRPEIYTTSEEYAPDPIEKKTIESNKGKIIFIAKKGGLSTSSLIKKESGNSYEPAVRYCPKYGKKIP